MKLPVNNVSGAESSVFNGEKGHAQVSVDNLSVIMGALIKNYSNPLTATLREWVSNAHDAHVSAGVKKPIEVSIPTRNDPVLSVRDYGEGMTHDEIVNVYLSLGNSTKRGDNTGIGGFGIGGKSALAVAEKYFLTTVKNGLKNVYLFERSDNMGLSYVRVVSDVETDDHSGVFVQVPVDHKTFKYKDLVKVLMGWSNSEVVIVNRKEQFFSIPDNSYTRDCTFAFEGETFTRKCYFLKEAFRKPARYYKMNILREPVTPRRDTGGVLVGPVWYYQNIDHGGNVSLDNKTDYIYPQFAIGDLSFPSSREQIENNARNQGFIKAFYLAAVNESKEIAKEIVATSVDKKELLLLSMSALGDGVKVTYKGEQVPDYERHIKLGEKAFMGTEARQYKSNKVYVNAVSFMEVSRISYHNLEYLFILDEERSLRSAISRLRKWLFENKVKCGNILGNCNGYVLITETPNEWDLAVARNVVKASEITKDLKVLQKNSAPNTQATTKKVSRALAEEIDTVRSIPCREWSSSSNKFLHTEMNVGMFFDTRYDSGRPLIYGRGTLRYLIDKIVALEHIGIDFSKLQFLWVDSTSKTNRYRKLFGDDVEIYSFDEWLESELGKFNVKSFSKESVLMEKRYPRDYIDLAKVWEKAVDKSLLHDLFKICWMANNELEIMKDNAPDIFKRTYYSFDRDFINTVINAHPQLEGYINQLSEQLKTWKKNYEFNILYFNWVFDDMRDKKRIKDAANVLNLIAEQSIQNQKDNGYWEGNGLDV